jgi:hypothetical protein
MCKRVIWMDNPTNYLGMQMDTRRIALLSVLTALGVSIQLLHSIPSVEPTSFMSFIVGVVFGSWTGGLLGALIMFANGFLSSWGLAGLNMPFQMAGMSLIGFVGGLYGKTIRRGDIIHLRNVAESVILGAFLTLLYDILTNFGFAIQITLFTGVPLWAAFVGVLIMGAIFASVHVASNIILFILAIPMVKAMRELTR